MEGTCARCGEERGDDRWCAVCGLDSTPDAIRLRTGESLDAGAREQAWFNSHPERLEEQRARMESWATTREREELERLGKMRPAAFGEYRDVSWRARLARDLASGAKADRSGGHVVEPLDHAPMFPPAPCT